MGIFRGINCGCNLITLVFLVFKTNRDGGGNDNNTKTSIKYLKPNGVQDIFKCSLNNFLPNLHKVNLNWLSQTCITLPFMVWTYTPNYKMLFPGLQTCKNTPGAVLSICTCQLLGNAAYFPKSEENTCPNPVLTLTFTTRMSPSILHWIKGWCPARFFFIICPLLTCKQKVYISAVKV